MKKPPYTRKFRSPEHFADWTFDMQQKGLNPVFKPIKRNKFRILRFEKI